MHTKYTIPKLSKNKKAWYVHYRYDGKQFRETNGFNKIKDIKLREVRYGELCKSILIDLQNGFNPNLPDGVQQNDMYIIEALRYACDKKRSNIAERTYKDYVGTINFIEDAVKRLKLDSLKIIETKRVHVKLLIEKVKTTRKWSNKSYNKNLGYLKAIFSELVQWDIIENNPSYGIHSLKVGEIMANIPASDDEIKSIKEKLLREFPNFYTFIVCIFHTGIRPKELLQIKLKMVNLEKNEFKLPPEITKTDIERIVPINPFLKTYLEETKIDTYNQELFLFGSKREYANRGLKKDLDFTPAPNMLNRDCASKLWRKLVKEDLKITANMYSMKHLGANKKILAGLEIDALRELYGHTSKMMTLRYAKVVKEVNRKQILDKSPDL